MAKGTKKTAAPKSAKPRKKPLRSHAWFGHPDRDGYMHRSWMKNQGHPSHHFDGRPVIGICNTWSDLTPCNGHFRDLAEHIKRGVYEAGGLPLEFPVFSTGETNLRPTAMLFRNLASMDVEESIRGNPVDGVILLVGCDKTIPAAVMALARLDIPGLVLYNGTIAPGRYRGRDVTIQDVFEVVGAHAAGRASATPGGAGGSGEFRPHPSVG